MTEKMKVAAYLLRKQLMPTEAKSLFWDNVAYPATWNPTHIHTYAPISCPSETLGILLTLQVNRKLKDNIPRTRSAIYWNKLQLEIAS